jgi:hypothetical protein
MFLRGIRSCVAEFSSRHPLLIMARIYLTLYLVLVYWRLFQSLWFVVSRTEYRRMRSKRSSAILSLEADRLMEGRNRAAKIWIKKGGFRETWRCNLLDVKQNRLIVAPLRSAVQPKWTWKLSEQRVLKLTRNIVRSRTKAMEFSFSFLMRNSS